MMHIALTFDNSFWAPAYATMRSVCLFTHRREELVFHLLHRTLSDEHRADLAKIQDEFPVHLEWYDLDQSDMFSDIAARMPENKRLSNIVYARLMIDRLVPADVTRILYLDCDMLVRDDIAYLFELDLSGNAIAAVRDTMGAFITSGRNLAANRDLFNTADYYFNAGMLVIDVAKWRDADIIGRMEEANRTGVMQRIYYDQDLLNLIFKNQWLKLDWRWNTIDARRQHENLDPAILHYTGERKPWGLFAGMLQTVAFGRLYRHVMTNDLFYRFARHRWQRWWKKKLGLR
ncbi:MAG: glycosyltransferase family 8 protein [Candidatus Devosia phytovorans]|uniref:Glycosyltransferase family 8 protein n=1 Tax=Candidatus Devosia phytovorans TaxID=3121372 RepID=A0AAJ6B0B1_9HYPH|nr:glycosyltransferase family 8 protein [Devosia sp.]WEK04029.1 MAG: glycosyltransferase family 8 protein [Devosia sp.]